MRQIGVEDYRIGELAFAYINRQLQLDRHELTSQRRVRPLLRARSLFTWIMRNHTGNPPGKLPSHRHDAWRAQSCDDHQFCGECR